MNNISNQTCGVLPSPSVEAVTKECKFMRAISNNKRYFGNVKPYMQCVNSVCIVIQKISSPTAKR
jgi:hypothetical protein